jgi:hypothetical protein
MGQIGHHIYGPKPKIHTKEAISLDRGQLSSDGDSKVRNGDLLPGGHVREGDETSPPAQATAIVRQPLIGRQVRTGKQHS